MDKSECCKYVMKMVLDNFDSIVIPSKPYDFMNLSDLLTSIKLRKSDRLSDPENAALNRRYCEIALYPLISKTYDELDNLYDYLDFIKQGKSFHEVLYEIICKKLG